MIAFFVVVIQALSSGRLIICIVEEMSALRLFGTRITDAVRCGYQRKLATLLTRMRVHTNKMLATKES